MPAAFSYWGTMHCSHREPAAISELQSGCMSCRLIQPLGLNRGAQSGCVRRAIVQFAATQGPLPLNTIQNPGAPQVEGFRSAQTEQKAIAMRPS
jgi:hypothetical protein